jgi:hypothetical protein
MTAFFLSALHGCVTPFHPFPQPGMQNQRSAHELEDGTPQDEQPDRPAKKLRLESLPSQPSSPKSESTAESDIDNEDDLVLSEVHIDSRNGRADGRLMTSTFNLGPESSILGDGDSADKLEDELEDEDDHGSWKYSVEIRHAMGTPLKDVGMNPNRNSPILPGLIKNAR